MRNHTAVRSRGRRPPVLLWFALAWLAVPSIARAQHGASPPSSAVGEKYHLELSGNLWNPAPAGTFSSEQFGLIGSDIDFLTDLGFEQTRFADLRAVLRPAKKHKLRVQYTPIDYLQSHTLARNVVFNGILYPAGLPITSEFTWKVLRFGYQYDVLSMSRGMIGVILEGRYTDLFASLTSNSPTLPATEFTSARAPLPALGLVGRAYVVPYVALGFEVTGFRLPNVSERYQANAYDWDVSGTVNFINNAGIQIGWRKMTTSLLLEHDTADFKFQGWYFGGVVRF